MKQDITLAKVNELKQELIREFTPQIAGLSFLAGHVEIWTNGQSIENWRIVESIPLNH